jgi:hypothetical protein
LEDGDIIKTTLSSSLFPGISSSIKVDSGFAIAQALYVYRYSPAPLC